MGSSLQQLYNNQHGRCYYCTVKMDTINISGQIKQTQITPTFDHIILKSNGGKRTVNNGVCACRACNQLRGELNFNTFKHIVTDINARIKFKQQKYSIKKVKMRVKVYPRCEIKATSQSKKTITRQKRNKVRLILAFVNQGGRCACCTQYTLDPDHRYDDLSAKAYYHHQYKPVMYKRSMRCLSCYKKRRTPHTNWLLTFFKNLL